MRRVVRDVCAFALILLLNSDAAWAQTAEINGKVTDQSGAVLPGVTVTRRRPIS